MCLTPDSQHCLGGEVGVAIIDVLMKILHSVFNILATLVPTYYLEREHHQSVV